MNHIYCNAVGYITGFVPGYPLIPVITTSGYFVGLYWEKIALKVQTTAPAVQRVSKD